MTFADATSVEKVLANGPHELDGKKVDPKVAFPKRSNPKVSSLEPSKASRERATWCLLGRIRPANGSAPASFPMRRATSGIH